MFTGRSAEAVLQQHQAHFVMGFRITSVQLQRFPQKNRRIGSIPLAQHFHGAPRQRLFRVALASAEHQQQQGEAGEGGRLHRAALAATGLQRRQQRSGARQFRQHRKVTQQSDVVNRANPRMAQIAFETPAITQHQAGQSAQREFDGPVRHFRHGGGGRWFNQFHRLTLAAPFHIGGDLRLALLFEKVGVVLFQHGVLALDHDPVDFRSALRHIAQAQRRHLGP